MGRIEIAWYMVRTQALHTVRQGSLNFPNKTLSIRRYYPKKVGSAAVILVAMVVMMVAIETMLVVMLIMMVMAVLRTLTQVPFHHDLATLLLALSIPAPPTIHKHPFPYFLSMPLPL
jgi:hypothetical protein